MQVGHETARVDRRSGGDPLQRGGPGDQGELGDVLRAQAFPAGGRESGDAVDGAAAEGADDLGGGQLTRRKRGGLGVDQFAVRVRGPAHGLRRVVDQDVQRALGRDRVGERDDLRGVTQIDADDLQPVDPLVAVRHRLEAADRVVGEASGDGGVRTVAQQPQRDVHADLRAAAGEERALGR